MLVRVFRARIRRGSEAEFEMAVRRSVGDVLAKVPGLLHVDVGRRLNGDAEEYVLVSVWDELGSLEAAASAEGLSPGPWGRSLFTDADARFIESATLDHFEALEPAPSRAPAAGAASSGEPG